MLWSREGLENRAHAYATAHGLQLLHPLGYGVHGIVFATDGKSALKVHANEAAYGRERDVYFRLREHGIVDVRGFEIPRIFDRDDELRVIEMDLVTPPFVLDFAGAYLDFPPEFSRETLADWQREKREQFGPRWPEVQAILSALRQYGIYYLDPNPGNIRFVE